MADFFEDRFEVKLGVFVSKTDLHNAYDIWCQQKKEEPPQKNSFGTKMKKKGFEEKKIRKRGNKNMGLKIIILIPVYNDWESFKQLVENIDKNIDPKNQVSILAVDDGSSLPCEKNMLNDIKLSRLKEVEVIHLVNNMGHQRAIAVGLSNLFSKYKSGSIDIDAIVIMDSDGEDRPQDLNRLISEYATAPSKVIVATRAKRSEGYIFIIFYFIYKIIFRLFTGKKVNFGNFSVLPAHLLSKIVFLSSTWNNLPATLIKSKIQIKRVPTERGVRYTGKSRMNFISLVTHGLSTISVFIEEVLIRILLGAIIASIISAFGILIVISVKFFTNFAIPGWASNVVGILTVIFFQTILLLIFAVFNILSNRSNMLVIPAFQAEQFILGRVILFKIDDHQ